MSTKSNHAGFITLPWMITFTVVALLLIAAVSVKLNHRLRDSYQSLFNEQAYYLAASAIELACLRIQNEKIEGNVLSEEFNDTILPIKLRVGEDEPVDRITATSHYSIQKLKETHAIYSTLPNVSQAFQIEAASTVPFRGTVITKSSHKIFYQSNDGEWVLIPVRSEPLI